jgi:hypothetical protein
MARFDRHHPITEELRAAGRGAEEAAPPATNGGPETYAPPHVREQAEALEHDIAAEAAELALAPPVAMPLAMIPDGAGALAGKTILLACQSTAEQTLAQVAAAANRMAQIKREAEDFVASLLDIGRAHEERIIKFVAELEQIQQSIEAGRKRLAAIAAQDQDKDPTQ